MVNLTFLALAIGQFKVTLLSVCGIFIGLIGIGFLIGFHELGHFLFAKLFNVRTPSFSIGFGPRLISKKIGDTLFSLSAIPLGGYVELAGAAEVGQGEQKEADRDDEFSFRSKPYYQKFLIMMGGILFNLMFAYFALILVFKIGLPNTNYLYPFYAKPIIEAIEPNSTAERFKLLPGDTITAINGSPITNVPDLLQKIQALPEQTAQLSITRKNVAKQLLITLDAKDGDGKKIGNLGVRFENPSLEPLSFIQATKMGISLANTVIYATIRTFKEFFTGKKVNNVRGPIFLIAETTNAAGKGVKSLLIFLAIISINLAILNLIPLPILDGGQIVFYGLEALFGRAIPAKVKEYIFMATWLAFITLFLYISYGDILPLINKLLKR